jgi:translocation-and-assembly-module (TAM) inner membrane subunit TamB-like protein
MKKIVSMASGPESSEPGAPVAAARRRGRPRRKRFWRRVRQFGCLVLLAPPALVVMLLPLVPLLVRHGVPLVLTLFLRRSVSIGDIDLGLLRITIEEVAIANAPGFAFARFAGARRIVLEPDWPGLLQGRLSLRSVDVDHPEFYLEIDAEKHKNIPRSGQKKDGQSRPPQEALDRVFDKIQVGRLTIVDGHYGMRLARQDLELDAPDIDLEIRRGPVGAEYDIPRFDVRDVHLRVGQRLDVHGTVRLRGGRADASGARAEMLAVDLEQGTRVVAVAPVLKSYPDPVLRIDPQCVVDLRDLARALHLPLELEGLAMLEGSLDGPARNLDVAAHLQAPSLEASKQGQKLRGEARQVSGQLELHGTLISAQNVHLSAFGGDVHIDGQLELARDKRSVHAQILQSGGHLLSTLQELGIPLQLDASWSAIAEVQSEGLSRETLRGRAVLLFEGPAPDLEAYRQPAAAPGSSTGPAPSQDAPAGTPEAPPEEGMDVQELLSLATDLAAREALARAELGQEESFPPRISRERLLRDLRDRPLPIRGKAAVSLGGGEVFIEQADLELPGSRVQGFGKIGLDKTLRLAFHARSEEVGILCYALRPYLLFKGIDAYPWTIGQGRGQIDGRLEGPTHDAVLDGTFEIDDGLYQRFAFQKLSGQLHFEDNQIRIQAGLLDGTSWVRAQAHIVNGTKGNLQTLRSPFVPLEWLSLLPDIDVLLESDDYSLPRLADQFGGRLPGSLHVRGRAHLFKEKEQLYSELNLEGLRAGYLVGQQIENLHLQASTEGGHLSVKRFRGSLNGSPVELAGTAELPDRVDLDLDLGPLELAPIIKLLRIPLPITGKARVVLAAEGLLPTPVLRLSLTTQGMRVEDVAEGPGDTALDLAIRGQQLLATGKLLGGTLSVSGSMELRPPFDVGLDLDLNETRLSPLLGLVSPKLAEFIEGELTGRFRLEGPTAAPRLLRVDGALQVASLQLTEVKVQNDEPVRIVLKDGRFELLPVRFSGTGGVFQTHATYQPRGPFDLHVDGIANLAIVKAFDRSANIDSITGKAAVTAEVHAAPLETPSITGRADLSEGYLKLAALEQSIFPISGTIHLDYPNLTVAEAAPLTANFGDGPVKLWGTVVANSSRFEDILLDLSIQGSRLNYHYLPEWDTTVSPDLHVTGTAAVPQVSGELVMNVFRYKGRIELKAMLVRTAEQTTGALLRSRTQLTAQEIQATSIDPVLDLTVLLPGSILIESKGVELKISSPQLRVVGTYLRMGLLGTLNVEEGGKIAYEDREFEVKHGQLEFLDPTRLDPTISLEMEAQVGNYDITISMTGTGQEPITQFTSVPPLPEIDILSLILGVSPSSFVDPTTGLSEQRSRSAEQLVGAAATALDLDNTLFQRVGNILAADRFLVDPVITASGFQGARITWGKGVGKLDILASQVLPATEPPLIVFKYQLTDHIFIEGLNQGGKLADTDVDLKFRWDFR